MQHLAVCVQATSVLKALTVRCSLSRNETAQDSSAYDNANIVCWTTAGVMNRTLSHHRCPGVWSTGCSWH